MKLQILNNSEWGDWRQCPRKWGFRYPESLVPIDRGPVYLDWGTLYHVGTATLWGLVPQSDISRDEAITRALAASAAQAQEWTEQVSLGEERDIAIERLNEILPEVDWAVEYYAEQRWYQLQTMVPVCIEERFEIPMGAGLRFHGTPDLAYFDPNHGDIVVNDGKTSANDVHSYEGRLQLDTQSSGYVWLVRKALERGQLKRPEGVPQDAQVSGRFVWTVAKRKIPTKPRTNLLKKADFWNKAMGVEPDFDLMEALNLQKEDGVPRGLVSANIQIDTLPQVYEQALQDQLQRRLPVTEAQRELLQRLKRKGDSYLQDTEHVVTDAQVERWEQEFRVDAKRMRAARKDPTLRTRNSLACSLPGSAPCAYRSVCIDPDARAQFFNQEGET